MPKNSGYKNTPIHPRV